MNDNVIDSKKNNYTFFNILNSKKILMVVLSIIVLIILFKLLSSNSYSKYENKMINLAKEYVINHGINANKEIYLDVSKMNSD